MKLKDKVEALEKRVALLEQRPVYIPYMPCPPYNPSPTYPDPNYPPYPDPNYPRYTCDTGGGR